MQFGRLSAQVAAFGVALTVVAGVAAAPAAARVTTAHHASAQAHANARVIQAGMSSARHGRSRGGAYVRSYGGGLQCVPFARENTGIELAGNAGTWWQNAEGVYERGARPEVGSVLNFRANGRMRMGHVAVVTNVENPRTVEIDHANWGGPGAVRGGVSRNITVVDVSERNDWSAVRVALGHTGEFGSVYPTYGFIYDRPDKGTMVANAGAVAPAPLLNAAPHDLRPARDRLLTATATQEVEEVAEAEDDTQPRSNRRGGRHTRTAARGAHGATRSALNHTAGSHAAVTRVHTAPAAIKPHHHRA